MGNIIDGGDGDANMEYIIKQTFVNFSCINAFKKLSKNLAVTQFWLVFQKVIQNAEDKYENQRGNCGILCN